MKKELKRIVTIGPAYPFRGGIAQYGNLLIKELEKHYEVSSVSFSMMYPKFLYPGKTQKDTTTVNPVKNKIQYLINSVNPFSYIKTAKYINKYHPDMVIMHWWQPFFSFADIGIARLLNKDIKLCICCNNVLPHDNIPLTKFFTKMVLRQGDMFMVHSDKEEQLLIDLLGRKPIYMKIPCPDISTFDVTDMTKMGAQEELGIEKEAPVLLFFGFIRKYKGLYHIINIMPQLIKKMPQLKLMIVGDFYEDKEKYFEQIERNGLKDHIMIFDQFIPDSDVEKYFKAADVVVLPYDSATTSGVIQAAYGFDRPVIVTDVGGLAEAVVDTKTGFVAKADDENDLLEKVLQFYEQKDAIDFASHIEAERYKYSWERVVNLLQEMWEKN